MWRTERMTERNEQSLGDPCNSIRYTSVCIMEIPEGHNREKGEGKKWRNYGWKCPKYDGKQSADPKISINAKEIKTQRDL